MAHATLLGALLELHAEVGEASALGLDVLAREGNVAKPAARLFIAVTVPLEFGVALSAPLSAR